MKWRKFKEVTVLTYEQKQKLYRAGQYVMAPPPVPTRCWSEKSWIHHIDATGGWLTEAAKRHQEEYDRFDHKGDS